MISLAAIFGLYIFVEVRMQYTSNKGQLNYYDKNKNDKDINFEIMTMFYFSIKKTTIDYAFNRFYNIWIFILMIQQ